MAESACRPRSSFSLHTLPQYGQAEIRFCYRSCGGTPPLFLPKLRHCRLPWKTRTLSFTSD